MNLKPVILACTSDEDAVRRISAAMHAEAEVLTTSSAAETEEFVITRDPAAIIVDVRCSEIYHELDQWVKAHPSIPFIAMGPARSDRILYLEHLDLFALGDPGDDYRTWRQTLRLAVKHRRALADLEDARRHAAAPPPPMPAPALPVALPMMPAPTMAPYPAREGPSIITRVTAAFRHFENVDLMLDRAVEELAAAAHTQRAGLFTRDEKGGAYRLRAGLRYLKETAAAAYEPRDPLVRWFERNTHMITRTLVSQMHEPAQRQLLTRSLELAGAEIIVPLHARGELLGWFFVGCRSTGVSYTLGDLEELSLAADYLAMLLENALLYREVTVQKSRAETLLHALPTGIIAVDEQGIIRWFSTSAEAMFGRTSANLHGQQVEVLGSRFAHQLRRALAGNDSSPPTPWEEPASGRYLQCEIRRLGAATESLGAVAIIQDLTAIRQLKEKQAQLERSAFWSDLAAGLSHEIRNPLVAIRTFAQLLPERYQEEDFREEFSKLVNLEIERLNSIIDQINEFANPPHPVRAPLDVREPLRKALARVFPPGDAPAVKLKARLDGNLPMVMGDEQALLDCFTHLLQNAAEALDKRAGAEIEYAAETRSVPGKGNVVQISIRDNGHGFPENTGEKMYSPFYTSKARGMGLGLPIVKRTVIDHNGQVRIDSNAEGTSVIIELPTGEAKT